ncbi:MAG: radical SAM protein [candidate division WWE3 bacterium]|nr:radical SAM protein [candidate division WWE3 bacterium]
MIGNRIGNREEKIKEILEELGEPQFRLTQINEALYGKGVLRYSEMLSLPQTLRETLEHKLGSISSIKAITTIKSINSTKVLFETCDGLPLETVARPDFICVSCQSGCAMKCAFCSTGRMGLGRSLSSDEIIDQVLYFKSTGYKISNITFMGMGEPLLNLEAVVATILELTDPTKFGLGMRKISLSTVGIVPGIKRMAELLPQINLAFSLHSPYEAERQRLMPISTTYPLDEVMKALDEHAAATHRQIFLEYVLIKDVNDDAKHARDLATLVKNRPLPHLFYVNLIKFHAGNKDITFEAPEDRIAQTFLKILKEKGINCSLRSSIGEGDYAACGQLGAMIDPR